MLTVFALIVTLQVLVAAISIDLLSAVRAYVTGESLYSKGQKDAQIYLIDYAEYPALDTVRRNDGDRVHGHGVRSARL